MGVVSVRDVEAAVSDAIHALQEWDGMALSKSLYRELLTPIAERYGITISEITEQLVKRSFVVLKSRKVLVTGITAHLRYLSALQAILVAAQAQPFSLESVRGWVKGRICDVQDVKRVLEDLQEKGVVQRVEENKFRMSRNVAEVLSASQPLSQAGEANCEGGETA
jgi:hypothetical protein